MRWNCSFALLGAVFVFFLANETALSESHINKAPDKNPIEATK